MAGNYTFSSNRLTGAAPVATPVSRFIGTITGVNPCANSADVMSPAGMQFKAVRIPNTYGNPFSTDLSWINSLRGATVIVDSINNIYYISAVLSLPNPQEISPIPITEEALGSNTDSTYSKVAVKNYSMNRPTDMLNGDKVLATSDGSSIGALRQGIAFLKASSLTQIILFKLKNLVRIVSRNFEIFTDFGKVIFSTNKDGKTSFRLQGGSSFKEETSPEQNKFTIDLQMGYIDGADGQLLQLTVGADKNTLISIDKDGKVDIKTSGDLRVSTDNNTEFVANKDMNLNCSGKLTLNGTQGVSIGATSGEAEITSSISVKLTAPIIRNN